MPDASGGGPSDDPPWLAQVERRAGRWAESPAVGKSWVVAVSGGGDSVGLVRALHRVAPTLGLTLSVAHLDHGARGDDSRADAAFVAELARSLGLPLDLGHWAATRSHHFEADARRARYAWLAGVARARGAGAVAVGHTKDDQAETVLHRVLRGTGVRGLAGIPARRPLGPGVTLVRPLLSVSRGAVRDYLAGLDQPCRDDPTNADTARTRARLRHDLLPRLAADYNPQVADALVRLARLAGASSRGERRAIRSLDKTSVWLAGRDELVFTRDDLLQLPGYLRAEAIRLAWRNSDWPQVAMGASRWRRLARLVRRERPGRFDIGAGVTAETGPQFFVLRRSAGAPIPPEAPTPAPSPPFEVPGSVDWLGGRVVVTLGPEGPCNERVDFDRLILPLSVRAPLPGDRFDPLGMGGRSQPLNDFFRGRRVGRPERARTPLVCDGLGIIWVVGHRISHRVRLTDSTTRPAGLRWEAARP